MLTIAERLSQLRQKMRELGVDFYYIPSSDAHQDEYVPACWQRRAWISGFTGSAGDVVVGLDQAYLWTDGRYYLQAEQQLDADCYALMRQGSPGVPTIKAWLQQNAQDKVVAVDSMVITLAMADQFQQAIALAGGQWRLLAGNLVDAIWHDQPELPTSIIQQQPLQYAGISACDKLTQVRKALRLAKADAHVVTSLDAIAWLFNIRGNDVEYNPVAISYAVVTEDQAVLFIDPAKVSDETSAYLQAQNIQTAAYSEVACYLAGMSHRVLLDPATASCWIAQQLTQATLVQGDSPISLLKACKNPIELKGTQAAHRRDGLALVKFMHWLEQQASSGLNEIDVANKLRAFRDEDPTLLGDSFPTICGFAEHGAIVHYRAMAESTKTIDDSQLLLIDSGAQYPDGTTDVTRVYHLGEPTAVQKRHYTLVLKGHLALRHTPFPQGTSGEQLDSLARQFLWQAGLDYAHGTGHGVGVYLCVHEGPQRIAPWGTKVPFQPGMLTSNEPGVYLSGEYGIRIENVCYVAEVEDHTGFYQLQDLTLAPHNRQLIDTSLLTQAEIDQVNAYHQQVLAALKEELPAEVQTWLLQATRPL